MALTPDQLRQKIPNWSLESDGQLLDLMKSIAKNVEEKCKKTSSNMNSMNLRIDDTNVRLGNATNKFLSLHQSKFVENRVVDEDETAAVAPEIKEETEKDPKLAFSEIFQLTVENSIENVYKCFEKVTVELESDSDDEDEDSKTKSILRAIQSYPYINRPLPYIIGSKEWREKWHAGLIESDDESESEEKEQFSESDSDDLSISVPSNAQTASESESGSVWGLNSTKPLQTRIVIPSGSEDDSMSVASAGSIQKPVETVKHRAQIPTLFPELPPEENYQKATQQKGLFDDSDDDQASNSDIFQETKNNPAYFRGKQAERKSVNLINNDPPTPTTVQPKRTLNLFLESDEDDDGDELNSNKKVNLFDNEPPEDVVKTSSVNKKVNLFDDNDFDEYMDKLSDTRNNNNVNNNTNIKPKISKLFDDVNDNDDFISSINPVTHGTIKKIANLFDDDPPIDDFDDIFKPKISTVKKDQEINKRNVEKTIEKQKKSAVNTKENVGENQTKNVVEKVDLFSEEYEEDDIFKPRINKNLEKNIRKVENENKVVEKVVKKVNLFDQDVEDEDDIFKPVPKKVVNETRKEVLKLFDNLEEKKEAAEIFPPKPAESNAVLTQEKSVPDFIPPKDEPKINEEIIKGPPASVQNVRNLIEKKRNLFASSDEEEESEPETEPPQIQHISNEIEYHLTTNKVELFEEDDSFDELIKKSIEENLESSHKSPKKAVTSNQSALNFSPVGIFDDIPPPDDENLDDPDSFENEENNFNKAESPSINKHQASFLFYDEPPDDEIDNFSAAKPSEKMKSISKIIEERNKNESVFENKEKAVPKVNKLNKSFSINVAALLPGARPPQSNKSPPPVPNFLVEKDEITVDTSPKYTSTSPNSNSNVLASLNKTRAKIQVKRRPSTRHGRKLNYQQSLKENSVLLEEDSSDETERIVVGSDVAPKHSEIPTQSIVVINSSESGLLFANNDDEKHVFKSKMNRKYEENDQNVVAESSNKDGTGAAPLKPQNVVTSNDKAIEKEEKQNKIVKSPSKTKAKDDKLSRLVENDPFALSHPPEIRQNQEFVQKNHLENYTAYNKDRKMPTFLENDDFKSQELEQALNKNNHLEQNKFPSFLQENIFAPPKSLENHGDKMENFLENDIFGPQKHSVEGENQNTLKQKENVNNGEIQSFHENDLFPTAKHVKKPDPIISVEKKEHSKKEDKLASFFENNDYTQSSKPSEEKQNTQSAAEKAPAEHQIKEKGVEAKPQVIIKEEITQKEHFSLPNPLEQKHIIQNATKNPLQIKNKSISFDEDKEIFKQKPQPQAQKNKKVEKSKIDSIFDDEINNELFKKVTKPPPPKVVVKQQTNLFDSDSESDLFVPIRSNEAAKKMEKVKEKENQKSIFSDDEDDDIFGKTPSLKTKKLPVEKVNKHTSLFGDDDDDDDDLFGGKKTRKEPSSQSSSNSALKVENSKKTIKSTTPIDDPLADLL